MRKTIVSCGVFFIVLTCSLSTTVVAKENKGVAAVVNGDEITLAEINRTVKAMPQYQKLQLEILEDMIVKTLIYQESVKDGITVTQDEVNKGFKEYISRLGLDEKKVKDELLKLDITEEILMSEIKKLLMVERFLDKRKKTLKLTVSDEEVKAFYDEHPDTFNKPERIEISHIAIKSPAGEDEAAAKEAMKKILMIQEKLKKGEGTFADLAKEYSEDTMSAENGGALKGEITRNSPLPKTILDAAFELNKGEVSDVVKSSIGFHLIKVTEKKPAEITPYGEIKDSLKFRLLEQKSAMEMKEYVDSLVAKSDIQIKLEKRKK